MSGRRFTYDECGKTIARGTMDAGINNVIYMELYLGPKMANGRCGKTIDTGTIDRGSTVFEKFSCNKCHEDPFSGSHDATCRWAWQL